MSGLEVVLVRHGPAASVDARPISGRDLGQWVRRYDQTGVDREVPPPERVLELVAATGCVAASDLRRSVESAMWVTGPNEVRIDPELREAALPDSLNVSVWLPPGVWVVLARIAWWLRWCESAETVDAARERARRATTRLCALADEHGSVVVVGHGMFNRFIARELVTRGWRGPMWWPTAHWAVARFQRPDQPVSQVRVPRFLLTG